MHGPSIAAIWNIDGRIRWKYSHGFYIFYLIDIEALDIWFYGHTGAERLTPRAENSRTDGSIYIFRSVPQPQQHNSTQEHTYNLQAQENKSSKARCVDHHRICDDFIILPLCDDEVLPLVERGSYVHFILSLYLLVALS